MALVVGGGWEARSMVRGWGSVPYPGDLVLVPLLLSHVLSLSMGVLAVSWGLVGRRLLVLVPVASIREMLVMGL